MCNVYWTSIILRSTNSSDYSPIEPILGAIIQFSIAILTGAVGSLTRKLRHEITVRIESENMLKKYQNQLEEMVQQRTQELQTANEHLRQAEKMEAIGQLAGGIAHDFNNQLMIIMGYCELLSKALDSHSAEWDYVKQIQTSGKRASDLTKQLLAFARKSVYKQQVVSINELASEVISLFSRSVDKIQIISKLNAVNPYIIGGPTQLQNVLLNLALNARDAMENGGTLTFETENIRFERESDTVNNHKLPPGDYVSVSVKDTGIGIDPTTMAHIFEPFFTTKEEGKGTGMGLATVYGMVSSHKGGIKVNSIIGEGTTFALFFPAANENSFSIADNSSVENMRSISPIRN